LFILEGRGTQMLIHGNCHCGNISFELTLDPGTIEIPARACDCSFCMKHGAVWTSDSQGSLKVTIEDRSLVTEYAFGTQTAQFYICRRCGIVPVATGELAGRLRAVVSVNALTDVPPSMLRRSPVSFEGEDIESRLTRRERNWIPNVEFV
jgi:hypothetical protein